VRFAGLRSGPGGYHRIVLTFVQPKHYRTHDRACPDCWAVLEDERGLMPEPGPAESLYRCTRCGAGWETNAAGWLFPFAAA
jgi:hypothetical protein